MSSNPSTGEAARPSLDLNSVAMAGDHITAMAEPVPCPPEDSGRPGESAAETLAEPPEGSFDLGESSQYTEGVLGSGDKVDSKKPDLEPEIDRDAMEIGVTKTLEQDENHTVLSQGGLGSLVSVVEAQRGEEEIPVMRDSMADVNWDAGDDRDQKDQLGGKKLPGRTEKQTIQHATGRPLTDSVENDQRARYYSTLREDKAGYTVPDLVWGKVRSHPWWPGQIFDPSDASEMALKHQKKDQFLVAYFGDRTFAWCDESRLNHFEVYFSQMEKQSSMDAFVNAVNAALGEVSRRVELGMTCYCSADESYSDIMYEEVENAGIRKGTCRSSVDRTLIVNSFQPDRLIEYIRELAQCPLEGADRLELVTAKAQLKGFYHSKGYPELPVYLIGGGLIENDAEVSLSIPVKKSGEDVVDYSISILSDMISGKGKSRGRPRSKPKNILEDGRKQKSLSELMEERDVRHLANGRRSGPGVKATSRSSGRKHKVSDSDSTDLVSSKKKRLDSLGDLETKSSSPTLKRSLEVGNRIRRVASQLKGSPSVPKCNGDTVQNSVAKGNRRRGGGVGINDPSLTHVETSSANDYSSSNEMLSQLCLAAKDPMKGYSFISMIVSFFTDFRGSLTSNSSKDEKHVESVGSKRGRKKVANSESLTSNFMQDSYWSDIILHSSPEKEPASRGRKRKGKSQKERQKKKTKPAGEPPLSTPLDPTLDTTQDLLVGSISPNTRQELEGERPIGNSVEKTMEEATPTALILSFAEPDALPSEADLIRIFGHYGPLDEAETEVLRKTNRAKVVFIHRADAEVAFSSAGKYSIFGPALVSYQLRYLQSSPKDASSTEVGN